MTLMADANQAHDPIAAAEVATAAAAAGFAWLEEPLPPEHLADYAALRSGARLPIAGGETIRCRREGEGWIASEAVDVIQPDACLAGGLEDALALSLAARNAGLVVAPHCYGLGLGLAASLHWAAALAGAGPAEEANAAPIAAAAPIWIEIDTSPNTARDALLAGCPWFGEHGARLRVPEEPGLGLDLDRIEGFRVA
jgi:D-galactarolactone cycloisomerase